MDSILWVIGLGLLLGFQHATDPDHVVAVATIVSREPRFRSGALIGVLWGLGHTLTLTVVGGAVILLNLTIPQAVALSLELAVALMLMGLGGLRLFWTFRDVVHTHPQHLKTRHDHDHGDRFHSHVHTHDGLIHRHPHIHPSTSLLRALGTVGVGQAVRSIAVGVVHGLAGSATLALLVLATIQNPFWALAYLGVFGAGTIFGMMVITAALAVPFAVSARRFARVNYALSMGIGLLSIGVGFFLAYKIGFVVGLLAGFPYISIAPH